MPSTIVSTINGRYGDVSLQPVDISSAGGALASSPALTGIPTVPTAPPGTNTTQIANTAFVQAAVASGVSGVGSFNGRTGIVTLQPSDITGAGGALLASPALTGTPTAPTPVPGTNTTQLATTQFVQQALSTFSLPIATTSTLGAVIAGPNVSINSLGIISVAAPYVLPAATTTTLGGVSVGTGLSVTSGGVLSNNNPTPYTLPAATTTTLGGVIVGSGLTITGSVLSANAAGLSPATQTTIGGVKIGANVSVQPDGTISVATPYTLPVATTSTLGGMIVGSGLNVTSGGVVSVAATTIPPATTTTIGGVIIGAGLTVQSNGLISIATGPSSTVVNTFNTRTGAVTLTSSDITGAGGALLASPAFTGNPTAPTPSAGDNSQNIATTAYANSLLGFTTVTLSSTTLTLNAAQYQAQGIVFTGSLTANTTVTFPNQGAWKVYNQTTGAFQLILNTAQITGGIVCPAAELLDVGSVTGLGMMFQNPNVPLATTTQTGVVSIPSGSGLTVSGAGALSANVISVAGRTGAVTLAVSDVSGAAPLASPAFTGNPTAPTQASTDNSTNVATTAFVKTVLAGSTVTSFNTRTGAVTLTSSDITGASGILTTGGAFSGAVTGVTPSVGDNSTNFATTAYVETAFMTIVQVAVSTGSVVLTAAQYGTQIIQFTGTLTGNVTVTFPSSGRWFVYNSTSGAFTITLTNGGSGSTATVAQSTGISIVSVGSTIGIFNNSALPLATTTTTGVVSVPTSGGLTVSSGAISLAAATVSQLGGVSVPATGGLSVTAGGAVSANVGNGLAVSSNQIIAAAGNVSTTNVTLTGNVTLTLSATQPFNMILTGTVPASTTWTITLPVGGNQGTWAVLNNCTMNSGSVVAFSAGGGPAADITATGFFIVAAYGSTTGCFVK